MKLAHVFAVLEIESGKETLLYLDESNTWTHDLQKAKVYETEDMNEIGKLEESFEAMAWSVLVEDDKTIQHLQPFPQFGGE